MSAILHKDIKRINISSKDKSVDMHMSIITIDG